MVTPQERRELPAETLKNLRRKTKKVKSHLLVRSSCIKKCKVFLELSFQIAVLIIAILYESAIGLGVSQTQHLIFTESLRANVLIHALQMRLEFRVRLGI